MKILFGNCQKCNNMGYHCFLAMYKILQWIPLSFNRLFHHMYLPINTSNLSRVMQNFQILSINVGIISKLPSRNILSFVYTMIHLNKFYSAYLFMLGPSFLTQSYLYGGGIKIFWNFTYAIIWSFGHFWSTKMQVFQ